MMQSVSLGRSRDDDAAARSSATIARTAYQGAEKKSRAGLLIY